jgi:lipoyl(octanoyl) transferase
LRVRWLGRVPYGEALDLQRGLFEHGAEDHLLLLEHPHVYTMGVRASAENVLVDPATVGAELVWTDRGGDVTYHGPGQLVGYPIVRLPDHVKVVDYVRRLEEALIHTCTELGVTTARVPGRSGVWLQASGGRPERKIAAIGIRVARGVTMHGFALNCDVDLGWYDRFVPCGIDDAGVTSLSHELGRDVTVAEAVPVVQRHLRELLSWAPYTPTPDYEPRPDPAKVARTDTLRVPVVNPLA